MKRVTRQSFSPEETERIGETLGAVLRRGDVIGLRGDLGSGKTCFVRGLARGLAIGEDEISSPSFVMVAEYLGRLPLYHIDLYRLDPKASDVEALREFLYGCGVSAIEWVERLPEGALTDYLEVTLTPVGPLARRIDFAARGERAGALIGHVLPASIAVSRGNGAM